MGRVSERVMQGVQPSLDLSRMMARFEKKNKEVEGLGEELFPTF